MFASAYLTASSYTHPVIVSTRFYDSRVESGLGSFVILNDEGWIITAAHMLDPMFVRDQHAIEIGRLEQQRLEIDNNNRYDKHAKERMKKNIAVNNNWLINTSHWWGADHHFIPTFHMLKENDIAIGKIDNYSRSFTQVYPVFKDPARLDVGTSLCKLGYPFYEIKAGFDSGRGAFTIDPSIFPIPRFPIEGMYTRNIFAGKSQDQQFDLKFLETSTPGLRGQSGGPTFDVQGRIWAIQSQTRHLPLGFSPKIKVGNKEVEENQFLNVGWGAHVETILKFLDSHGVRYQVG